MAGTIEPLGLHEKQNVQRGNNAKIRLDHTGAQVVSQTGTGRFGEAALKGSIFHALSPGLTLDATSGNLLNSTAANAVTATNTALVNPSTNTNHMVLLRVAVGVTSGTLPAGGLYHSIGTGQTVATSLSGMAKGFNGLANGTRATGYFFTKATGTTYTGASLAQATGVFAGSTSTAAANAFLVQCFDEIDGGIVLAPGDEYRPQFALVGTTVIYSVSYTWAEVPTTAV